MPTPTPEQTQLAIAAVEMILTHGVPTFMRAMTTIQADTPTLADIQALREAVKDPASYFEAQAGK